MERRRLNLDEPAQQELPLANPVLRRRVELGPGPIPANLSLTDSQVKDLNAHQDAIHEHAIKKAVARVQSANGQAAFVEQEVARIQHPPLEFAVDKVAFLCGGYTDWSRNRPPSAGYWELKQRSAAAPDPHNWWYSASINKWHRGVPQRESRLAGFVDHATLMATYEWRGMRKPWPEGYSYELEKPAFATDLTAAPDTQNVEVVGKLEVAQPGVDFDDLNPMTAANRARRRVSL